MRIVDDSDKIETADPSVPPPGRLIAVDFGCGHFDGFVFHRGANAVSCRRCKAELDPMFVLERLANKEDHLRQEWEKLQKAIELTREKMRTKCEHCQQMTRIKRS